ncbi:MULTISPECIES: hypothetical protein [unclassified Calothrix]
MKTQIFIQSGNHWIEASAVRRFRFSFPSLMAKSIYKPQRSHS